MPAPKVSYSDIEQAFLFASYERLYWLDKRTGRILAYSNETVLTIEEGELDDLPEWMEDEVKAAREVLRAFGELPGQDELDQDAIEPDRYVSIEQIPSHEAFQFMEDFVEALPDSRAAEQLVRALRGNKPFRRFKDALLDFPLERERWFEYESKQRREYIKQWAQDEGVEIDFSR